MEYHLDRSLRLLTEPEHKSLYSWAILEVDADGAVIEQRDQIPWGWTQYFTATEIILTDQLNIREGWEPEDGRLRQGEENRKTRAIRVKLRPGDARGDKDYFRRTTFKMFGTDRVLTDFELRIEALDTEEGKEECRAWGAVAYTARDLHVNTAGDMVQFTMMLRPSTFDRYARRFADDTIGELILGVGLVSGFYSEWSPDIHTRDIKVLAAGSEQKVELPVGIEFEPPRLGRVGEINLLLHGLRQQPDLGKTDDGEDGVDDMPAPALGRPSAETKTVADPEVAKHLASLRKSAMWIIGLLVVIAFIVASKS